MIPFHIPQRAEPIPTEYLQRSEQSLTSSQRVPIREIVRCHGPRKRSSIVIDQPVGHERVVGHSEIDETVWRRVWIELVLKQCAFQERRTGKRFASAR